VIHSGEGIWQQFVVAVKKHYPLASGQKYTRLPRCANASVLLVYDNIHIVPAESFDDATRAVCRAVINDHSLEVSKGLIATAP
jgi:hypothetical protein